MNKYSILEQNGWIVECEMPFEIFNEESCSSATGEAAHIVLKFLLQEKEMEDKQN